MNLFEGYKDYLWYTVIRDIKVVDGEVIVDRNDNYKVIVNFK
jgi:hypothetical protein